MLPVVLDNTIRVVGVLTLLIAVYRGWLGIYRRLIRQPKKPTSYGKWAVVTGSTSGIGKEYADYLAKRGMSILAISRSKDKLIEQCNELKAHNVQTSYLAYDFTDTGPAREQFYAALDKELQKLDKDGGVGLLINNVGTTNQYPQTLMELTDKEVNDMINCNMHSTVFMTRAVLKYMSAKDKGAVVNVSSGSGLICAPYIAVYSATKAFITQFSRSMHVENLKNGVDFLVVMPLYVVSNLFRKDKGDLFWPMPIKLVEGTFAQLGKKMVYQGHGYWMHGVLSLAAQYSPLSLMNNLNRMDAHRANYRKKLERQKAEQAQKDKSQ
mmetsp:Transcript_38103/g.75955  ORF Transcript_38103/g.75955 Transcript_38103/m.75955 type:complete len:324 (+) Transcript_38103:82-1053(+)